ncbi:hypothetical protein [Ruminococcus flavefaciens]|uniref:hypothetical protein n=1 Tax=Ruminococcus flavefaciens TaxID=1265 RepID=UPI000309219F|nr:hypothetical protein [Ruminococcus flavefaciens]
MKITKKRLSAALAAVFFVLVLFCSSVFIIKHTVHECTGEGCAVCMELSLCRSIMRSFDGGSCHKLAAAAVLLLLMIVIPAVKACFGRQTLVSMKVELLN